MKKRMIVMFCLTAMLFISCNTYASKKMATYNEVIKIGNTAYCGNTGIYKVNLKSGKVTVLRRNDHTDDVIFTHLSKKGSWIYFIDQSPSPIAPLRRVNIKTKKCETIGTKKTKIWGSYQEDMGVEKYVISGSKIYFSGIYSHNDRPFKKVMKLNGKGKKNTKEKITMKTKRSNAKGYELITKCPSGSNYFYTWLKTPKKKIFLGKSRL